jgi:hypothetical protein
MGSVHTRRQYILNFWFKSAYRNEHLTPRHCSGYPYTNGFFVLAESLDIFRLKAISTVWRMISSRNLSFNFEEKTRTEVLKGLYGHVMAEVVSR